MRQLYQFDAEYVRALIADDEAVQLHFYQYFGPLLSIKLRMRVRSPELREDIVQDTFCRIMSFLRRGGELEHPERLGALVNTVCNNVLLERFRSEGRSCESLEEHLEIPDGRTGVEEGVIDEQRKRLVRRLLSSLQERDRLILQQVFLEERDKDLVCAEMGVDRNYLRVLVHRAKTRFKVELQGDSPLLAMFFGA